MTTKTGIIVQLVGEFLGQSRNEDSVFVDCGLALHGGTSLSKEMSKLRTKTLEDLLDFMLCVSKMRSEFTTLEAENKKLKGVLDLGKVKADTRGPRELAVAASRGDQRATDELKRRKKAAGDDSQPLCIYCKKQPGTEKDWQGGAWCAPCLKAAQAQSPHHG